MIGGYYTALERTFILGEPTAEQLRVWEANVAVHERGLELIKPGARCSEIAQGQWLGSINVVSCYGFLRLLSTSVDLTCLVASPARGHTLYTHTAANSYRFPLSPIATRLR